MKSVDAETTGHSAAASREPEHCCHDRHRETVVSEPKMVSWNSDVNADANSLDAELRDVAVAEDLFLRRGMDPAVGLSDQEATARRAPSESRAPRRPVWAFAARQARDPMVLLLVVAAAVALSLGEQIDAVAILVIVLLNACFGAVQEFRADRALAALAEVEPARARVRRSGRVREVEASEVVVGDVVLIEAGDRLPADLRWLVTIDLRTDESLLSGESEPVEKDAAAAVAPERLAVDRAELGFAGSMAVRGRGEGVAFAVADATQTGRVRGLLRSSEAGETPLRRQLRRLGRRLSILVVVLAVVLFVLGTLRGEPPGTMLLVALSLAVAALPEALPAVVTAALALGSRRMVKRKALVRRLEAAEALGSVSVIASDKTGTLTTNRMALRSVWMAGDADWTEAEPQAVFDRAPDLVRALASNNDCERDEERWIGDPTEVALAEFAAQAGFDRSDVLGRIAEIPFDSVRKRMTTVHAEGEQRAWIVMKGSAETVIDACASGAERDVLMDAAAVGARSGHRVLGVAHRRVPLIEIPADGDLDRVERLEGDLEFLGFVGLIDPPRKGAKEAVAACRRAGQSAALADGRAVSPAVTAARQRRPAGG